MSYKGFKRVLGETSLERKCRWWFGISLGVLLFLSFYWYGQRMREVVYDSDRKTGPELVRTAWLESHFTVFWEAPEASGGDTPVDLEDADWRRFLDKLLGSSRELGRAFESYAILPQDPVKNPQGKSPPQHPYEWEYLNRWAEREGGDTPAAVDEALDAEGGLYAEQPKSFAEQIVEVDGKQVYRFYQPVYAGANCVNCHNVMGNLKSLQQDDLMAVVRVEIDQQDTRTELARSEALMWAVAAVIGFLSMFLLYFIVRYVIVKPVQHLRDVANAVREGDIAQRAEIHTGDEFEELAAAFNRMLRRLLRQQDALQEVNGELDGKIDQLAQANMRLFEMNRLKSDFLATMSHELRTPLNSILGFSDVLSTIESLDDKQRRYVGNIQRSGKMLLEMINDILDLAKMESGKMDVRPVEFRVDHVVGAQCDLARPLSERKNIDLELTIQAGLPPMRQDQAKLQQVLNNLLSNAIKFTPEGGRIMVRVGCEGLAEPGGVAESLVLEVEDTGIGIGEEDQVVVFEKFRQGASAAPRGDAMTREHSGTGLGLSIVREICRLLGGEVSLRSVSGKGSTFTVVLPWRLERTTNLDAELEKGVAELTRPNSPALSATTSPAN
ncbi:Autoinducer 2 sensor kinase/phosphatase LuxQ [Pseudobythopirellula maris]|uniref:histidine kinase n=1 Tax=Pseudobythopirellula maris TaxID=2527991 RepID=A0A5C5ZUC3_9BACT|nr:Autoinducer 2 sensor kinase/phosphatase LuxQ [Pseudobythopirellula maris]